MCWGCGCKDERVLACCNSSATMKCALNVDCFIYSQRRRRRRLMQHILRYFMQMILLVVVMLVVVTVTEKGNSSVTATSSSDIVLQPNSRECELVMLSTFSDNHRISLVKVIVCLWISSSQLRKSCFERNQCFSSKTNSWSDCTSAPGKK